MKCTKCGAGLMETDQFCPECGTRVIKEKRCPDCGAVLREGTKFCHKCGRLVENVGSGDGVSDETLDIPMEAIERNILSETEAELKADRRRESVSSKEESVRPAAKSASSKDRAVRPAAAKSTSSRDGSARPAAKSASSRDGAARPAAKSVSAGDGSARPAAKSAASKDGSARPAAKSASSRDGAARPAAKSAASRDGAAHATAARGAAAKKKEEPDVRRKSSIPAPPPRNKRSVYRNEDWDDDNWEEDDDWDDDDDWDEEEEEGTDIITIMTAVIGCVILVVVALLGFNLYKQYVPKNYEQAEKRHSNEEQKEEEEQEEQEEQDAESGQDMIIEGEDGQHAYKLTIVSNVNVRDQPSTSGTNIIKVAKEGETYTCNGSVGDGSWYEIQLDDGSVGYVFKDYVSVEE